MAKKEPTKKADTPKATKPRTTPVRNSAVPKVAKKAATAVAATIVAPSHDQIAMRAYELYAAGTPGTELDHWHQAERELRKGL